MSNFIMKKFITIKLTKFDNIIKELYVVNTLNIRLYLEGNKCLVRHIIIQ